MNPKDKDDLLEAMLHLFDGASYAYVARRYGFHESYLAMVRNCKGPGRAVRREARKLYLAYRSQQ